MRLWAIIPDEPITDDRAYLLGYLKSVFDEVITSRAARTANRVPEPERSPDMVLNLVCAKNRALLDDIDAHAQRCGVPVSPPSDGSWRTEDKRTYLTDYPDVSPPTRIARSMDEVDVARTAFGGDIVIKDPFGFWGKGVERISSDADMPVAEWLLANTMCDTRELIVQPYYSGFSRGEKRIVAQRTPDNSFEIIAYIFKQPPDRGWKSNIKIGGQSLRTELTDAEVEFALAVAPRAGIDNVALDVAEHDGRLYYVEHNQGYGGIVDFDLDRGTRNVSRCGEFLLHVARHGRPDD
ncbi:MAG: hypothetical protein OEN23_21295 [Paracoccaceae bacterium]|nr:hypothetical protein [Paracoccaceae bacterium]